MTGEEVEAVAEELAKVAEPPGIPDASRDLSCGSCQISIGNRPARSLQPWIACERAETPPCRRTVPVLHRTTAASILTPPERTIIFARA
jgi:hypothetical protein